MIKKKSLFFRNSNLKHNINRQLFHLSLCNGQEGKALTPLCFSSLSHMTQIWTHVYAEHGKKAQLGIRFYILRFKTRILDFKSKISKYKNTLYGKSIPIKMQVPGHVLKVQIEIYVSIVSPYSLCEPLQ